jgi:hypothetical protein
MPSRAPQARSTREAEHHRLRPQRSLFFRPSSRLGRVHEYVTVRENTITNAGTSCVARKILLQTWPDLDACPGDRMYCGGVFERPSNGSVPAWCLHEQHGSNPPGKRPNREGCFAGLQMRLCVLRTLPCRYEQHSSDRQPLVKQTSTDALSPRISLSQNSWYRFIAGHPTPLLHGNNQWTKPAVPAWCQNKTSLPSPCHRKCHRTNPHYPIPANHACVRHVFLCRTIKDSSAAIPETP